MSTTTPPSLSDAPQWAWDRIVEIVCHAQAEAYDRGWSAGWQAAQEQAEQGVINRQVSRAGVQNIGTELARAKADGRPPRLYLEGAAR